MTYRIFFEPFHYYVWLCLVAAALLTIGVLSKVTSAEDYINDSLKMNPYRKCSKNDKWSTWNVIFIVFRIFSFQRSSRSDTRQLPGQRLSIYRSKAKWNTHYSSKNFYRNHGTVQSKLNTISHSVVVFLGALCQQGNVAYRSMSCDIE